MSRRFPLLMILTVGILLATCAIGLAVPKAPIATEEEVRMDRKLRAIVLPQVELKNVPFAEAVAILKAMSVRYDPRCSQKNRGVNIVFKEKVDGGEAPTVAAPGNEWTEVNPAITYSAANVSLFDAITAVAKLGHYEVVVLPGSVSFAKAAPPYILVTKEWKLPPTGPPEIKLSPLPEDVERKIREREGEARDWLISGGVTFEGPRSMTYIERTHRLVVRDVQAHLDEIDKIVEAA